MHLSTESEKRTTDNIGQMNKLISNVMIIINVMQNICPSQQSSIVTGKKNESFYKILFILSHYLAVSCGDKDYRIKHH